MLHRALVTRRLAGLSIRPKSGSSSSLAAKRVLSTSSSVPTVISKSELKELMKKDSKEKITLIDVREPHEIQAGRIPTAKHAPLGTLLRSLPDPESFEESFGFPRPDMESRVVFYCKAGGRSQSATEYARMIGFKKAQNYSGSWLEWSSTESNIEK